MIVQLYHTPRCKHPTHRGSHPTIKPWWEGQNASGCVIWWTCRLRPLLSVYSSGMVGSSGDPFLFRFTNPLNWYQDKPEPHVLGHRDMLFTSTLRCAISN